MIHLFDSLLSNNWHDCIFFHLKDLMIKFTSIIRHEVHLKSYIFLLLMDVLMFSDVVVVKCQLLSNVLLKNKVLNWKSCDTFQFLGILGNCFSSHFLSSCLTLFLKYNFPSERNILTGNCLQSFCHNKFRIFIVNKLWTHESCQCKMSSNIPTTC